MDEVPEILLCEVANEIEATMIVNLLSENEIPARSDASQAGFRVRRAAFRARAQGLRRAHRWRERLERSWRVIPISRSSETSTNPVL